MTGRDPRSSGDDDVTPPSPYAPGDVLLDKYEIVRALGSGGMGIVLAARHRELDELVAIKLLLPSRMKNPELATRFLREARAASRIKNEHVARVFDVGSLPDGAPFMVMEYLRGADLASVLRARGSIPSGEAVDLLLQACEAISEAHALGFVHRDLKPANLFVTTSSDGLPFVKVLDFGVSKSLASDEVAVTSTSAIVGTPLYMSPEQLTTPRDVDARTDVWSLGVVLYELLTGAPPFGGSTLPTLCSAILTGTIPAIGRADVAPLLEAAVLAALTRDRTARPESVEAMAALLLPFGSSSARLSYERIARISGRAPAEPQRSPLAFDSTISSGEISKVSGKIEPFSRSALSGLRTMSRRRWIAPVLLGGLGTSVLLGVAALRHRPGAGADEHALSLPDPTSPPFASSAADAGATSTVDAAAPPVAPANLVDASTASPEAPSPPQPTATARQGARPSQAARDKRTPVDAGAAPPRPPADLFEGQK